MSSVQELLGWHSGEDEQGQDARRAGTPICRDEARLERHKGRKGSADHISVPTENKHKCYH